MKTIKAALYLAGVVATTHLQALDFDFSGKFAKDNDVVGLNFSVGAPSTVTIFSSSWLFGGVPNPTSGFDPVLALWDSTGKLIDTQDDGFRDSLVDGPTVSNGVAYKYGVWDIYYTTTLPAGNYFATITQYDNLPVGTTLSDGFLYDGVPNDHFTVSGGVVVGSPFGDPPHLATQPDFNGLAIPSDPRTGAWAVHILVPDAGSTINLLAVAMVGLGLVRWKSVK